VVIQFLQFVIFIYQEDCQTFASLYVEEMISSKFGISIKTENQKTGEIFFDVTPEFENIEIQLKKYFI
jgi:hypothetical protein